MSITVYRYLQEEKLYNELVEAKKNLGNAEFNASNLSELKYINAVIKETLRKYPTMGWLDRVAAVDYKIDDKVTVTAGTPVYVNAIGMHFDPEYFPEPKQFNPDRFLPENEHNIKPFTYMPFGEGPRNCIGRRFALQSFLSAVAGLTFHYVIRPLPNSPLPDEVEFEKRGIFLMPQNNLYLQFLPREKIKYLQHKVTKSARTFLDTF